MHILLITHRFLPRFVGGVEFYTLRLAKALQALDCQVHILTGEPVTTADLAVEMVEETYDGLPVTRLLYDYARRPVSHWASYSDPLVTAQIERLLRRRQPDVVHAVSLSLLMAGAIEAAANCRTPLVYTVTDFVLTCRRGTYVKRDNTICAAKEEAALCSACMGPHTGLEKWLDRLWRLAPKALAEPALPLLEKLLGKRADFIYAGDSIAARLSYLPAWRQRIDLAIAPSSYARETLIRNDFPPERIVVSPYGVNPPDPALKKRPSGQLRFAFIGRITYLKGVHLLIEAAARLNRPDRAEFIIYGRPDVKSDRYYRALQAKARALPNLHWAGFVDNAGVSQLYQTIDVLVVPSLWPENSPMTVLEALAHGVPVIASHVAGITDLVQHEVNGLLFANQQVDDLTAHLRRCLASPEVVTQLAQNCRLVKSMADDAAELCQRYAQLLANRRQAQ